MDFKEVIIERYEPTLKKLLVFRFDPRSLRLTINFKERCSNYSDLESHFEYECQDFILGYRRRRILTPILTHLRSLFKGYKIDFTNIIDFDQDLIQSNIYSKYLSSYDKNIDTYKDKPFVDNLSYDKNKNFQENYKNLLNLYDSDDSENISQLEEFRKIIRCLYPQILLNSLVFELELLENPYYKKFYILGQIKQMTLSKQYLSKNINSFLSNEIISEEFIQHYRKDVYYLIHEVASNCHIIKFRSCLISNGISFKEKEEDFLEYAVKISKENNIFSKNLNSLIKNYRVK